LEHDSEKLASGLTRGLQIFRMRSEVESARASI
jgi:hypothetical protein